MKVFVFPLTGCVFYPNTAKPLNIFEPRYLEMINDSLTTQTPIALAFADEGDGTGFKFEVGKPLPFVREISGYGLPQIIEKRPDGSLLVLMKSLGKCRLKNTLPTSTPYLVCEAESLTEDMDIKTESMAQFLTVHKVLVQWINANIGEESHRQHFLEQLKSPAEAIGCAASYCVQDVDLQQMILEAPNMNEKVNLLYGILSSNEVN